MLNNFNYDNFSSDYDFSIEVEKRVSVDEFNTIIKFPSCCPSCHQDYYAKFYIILDKHREIYDKHRPNLEKFCKFIDQVDDEDYQLEDPDNKKHIDKAFELYEKYGDVPFEDDKKEWWEYIE